MRRRFHLSGFALLGAGTCPFVVLCLDPPRARASFCRSRVAKSDLADWVWAKAMRAQVALTKEEYVARLRVYREHEVDFGIDAFLAEVHGAGIELSTNGWVNAAQAYGRAGDVVAVQEILHSRRDWDTQQVASIHSALMTAYGASGSFADALGVLTVIR